MMGYDQSTLDLESFQSYLSQHADPNDSRFYDDFFNIATSGNDWKQSKRLPGLPTPPATPDKLNFDSQQNLSITSPHYFNQQKVQGTSAAGLQVVPESMHDDTPSNYSWFQESNKFFNDTSSMNISPHHVEERRIRATTQAPNMSHDGPFTSFNNLQDSRLNTTHLSLNTEPVPECVLSPVSPRQGLKRVYPFTNAYATNSLVIHSPNPVISPIAPPYDGHDFYMNNLRTSEENYYKQLQYEKMRYQQKVDGGDTPQVEPELSRATHNVLERQRRNDLKLRFNVLRDSIPELSNNDKAPKIQILKKGLEFLAELKSQEQKLLVDLELEKQRKIILLTRLKILQQTF